MKATQAGSLESCDILITIEPVKEGTGIIIDLESPAKKQFGDLIISEIKDVVEKMGIKDIKISATDKGSLRYCIKARTETALKRALGENKK
ncbi:MAG TPA: citrate lyase acyl carrier protein [candidate division Zixibacteria bacterium]|nr:citrate lyase acyl carrier protein [candidate division Zixibacteria bacterium]